jgi:hypothetical protein
VTSRGLLQNTSAAGGSRCAGAWLKSRNTCCEVGLYALVVPLEIGIRNDASTFDTSDLAGLVFLFRDGVGDQAAVCTGAGWALSGSLRCLSCFFEVPVAPPCYT